MTLATLGWCAFWTHVALAHVAPGAAPPPALTRAAMAACALLGLAGAVLSLRAKRAWILLGLVAILANASLLALPWLAL